MLKTGSKHFASLFWKLWYPFLTGLLKHSPVAFLNYGYAEADGRGPNLEPGDETDRPCIQLYHHVAGAIDLSGQRVLEISCGHGGGASYVARYLKVACVHGIDRNPKAISFCRERHSVPGLSFSEGNALKLDVAAESFDAVINIEASHCYPDMVGFLHEVRRVLRPGGHLLYADFRAKGRDCDSLRADIEQSGLTMVDHEDISRGVVLGMQQNHEKYMNLIHRLMPWPFSLAAKRFAGVKGSTIYRELQSGETIYFRYAILKPMAQPSAAQ